MTSGQTLFVLLASTLCLGCSDREALDGSTGDAPDEASTGGDTGGDDADPSATSGGAPTSSGSGSEDGDGSSVGGDPTPGDEGPGPDTCQGTMPTCFEDLPGQCAHIVNELPAECEGFDWVCPEGYAFESDLQCETPTCIDLEVQPDCWVGGDCAGEHYPSTCVDDVDICEEGDSLECEWLCAEGDRPPSDCYDQGPGKCADFAPPPNCTDGVWTCPNGFDFGGYGEDCTFPGG